MIKAQNEQRLREKELELQRRQIAAEDERRIEMLKLETALGQREFDDHCSLRDPADVVQQSLFPSFDWPMKTCDSSRSYLPAMSSVRVYPNTNTFPKSLKFEVPTVRESGCNNNQFPSTQASAPHEAKGTLKDEKPSTSYYDPVLHNVHQSGHRPYRVEHSWQILQINLFRNL